MPLQHAELEEPRPNGALPAWVRAAAVVGIPGLIAIYLVYIGASSIAADVRLNRDLATEATRMVREHMTKTEVQMEALRLNMYFICRGVSRDAADRAECRR